MADSNGRTRVVRSTCMMSHSGCGVLVYVNNGKVVKVEGDPSHPITKGSLCPKGLAAGQFQYHKDRLLYPIKRAGERGGNQWKRIGWDEAYQTIVEKISQARTELGPQALGVACGTGRPILNYARRFAHMLGTPYHVGVPHICWRPQLGTAQVTFGRPIHYELSKTECLVTLGANWLHSNSGQGIFAREYMEVVRRGAKTIVIDPRLSAVAGQASLWLKVRPGTDAALLLAWINIIISEGLYDHEFVSKWTVGFKDLTAHVSQYSPEWAEKITWIPAEKIIESARLYASTKPATFSMGVSAEQSTNSFNTLRAINILMAITGNVDIPGGNYFWENPLPGSRVKALIAREKVDKELADTMIGRFPLVDGSSPGFTIWDAINKGDDSPIKVLMVFGSNPLLTQENPQGSVYKALKKVNFLVVSDYFLTPTAELADIVLPAATYLEKDDINLRPVNSRGYLSFAQKAVEPLGEAKDDREMFIDICKGLGLDYGFNTVRELLDWIVEPLGINFAKLVEKGPIIKEPTYKKYETGLLRADKKVGFETPSGKVQLKLEGKTLGALDALPVYHEPPESPLSSPDLAQEYPFVLTTGSRRPVYFHTQYYQIPWLAEIAPEPRMEIHPLAAERLGIKEGDWVFVENQRGRCRQRAVLTYGIDPRVVHTDYAWWYPEKSGKDPVLHGAWEPNINLLVSSEPPYDPAFGSTQMRGLLCKVYRDEGVQ